MDFFLFGMAIVGIVAVGPIELFFPRAAYSLLGVWIWLILFALYFFILLLIALNLRLKIVVYGMTSDALKQATNEVLTENQMQVTWVGNMLDVPTLGVQACIESAGRAHLSKIEAAGSDQNPSGWLALERLLVRKMSSHRHRFVPEAILWITISLLLFGLSAVCVVKDLPRLTQAMQTMFDLE
jgi:hypothetical protein